MILGLCGLFRGMEELVLLMSSLSAFVQGLYIMVMGMGVVFSALLLVMLAIMALDRLFKGEALELASEAKPATVAAQPAASALAAKDQGLVAAIALALALQEAKQSTHVTPIKVIAIKNDSRLWGAVGRLK